MAARFRWIAGVLLALAGARGDGLAQTSTATGRGEIRLDSASLASGAGLTLTEFLVGRVPGLLVDYATGNPRSTPIVTTGTATGLIAPTRPLLYVDGVLQQDDPRQFGDGQFDLALPWDLPMADVAAITVHLGASAAGDLAFGAARGAIHVTTRAASPDVTFVRGTMAYVERSPELSLPANVGTFNADSTQDWCTLGRQSVGDCTAGGRTSFRPFAQQNPYRSTSNMAARVDANGMFFTLPVRASVSADRLGGVLPSDDYQRLQLALATGGAALGARATWRVDARHAFADGTDASWDGILGNPAQAFLSAGAIPSDTARQDIANAIAHTQASAYDQALSRTALAANATITLSPRSRLELLAATTRGARSEEAHYLSINASDTAGNHERLEWSEQSEQFAATVVREHRSRPLLRLESRMGVAWHHLSASESRQHIASGPYVDVPSWADLEGTGSETREEVRVKGNRLSLTFALRAAVGARTSLGAGVRYDNAAQDDFALLPFADARVDLLGQRVGRGPDWLDVVSVHAAYAEAADFRMPAVQFGALPDETAETVVGVTAGTWQRLTASLTHTINSTTGGAVWAPVPAGAGTDSALRRGLDWRATATSLNATVRSSPEASRAWTVGLAATHRAAEYTHLDVLPFLEHLGQFWSPYLIDRGVPLSALYGTSYTYADTSGDGIISADEIATGAQRRLGVTDAPWIFAAHGDLAVGRRVRIGAAVESRRGHVALDGVQAVQCSIKHCEALHDPSTPLAEQAKAVALDANIITDAVHPADFVRVREIFIEGTLATRLVPVRIRLSGYNVATWTRFPGADPETATRRGGVSTGLILYNAPLAPIYALRITFGN